MIAESLICLSLAIWHEAQAEPYAGRVDVASVIMNRVSKHKSDVCTEVTKPGQFPWAKGRFAKVLIGGKSAYKYDASRLPKSVYWLEATDIASKVLEGVIKTQDGLIAFDSRQHPEWGLKYSHKRGGHHFYYDIKVPKFNNTAKSP